MREESGSFRQGEHEIAYTAYGEGSRVSVLVHGLLFNRRMHEPLARELASRGNRVLTIDLLGHGASSKPANMWEYSMPMFADQVVALLDHLDVDQAVIAGTSLGANTTLEVAKRAPERVRGMVVEMPVLEAALLGCALAFTPLMVGLTFGGPAVKAMQLAARLVPRHRLPFLAGLGVEWIAERDPLPSVAVLQGLFFGEVAPHRTERRTFDAPTLVIGHERDPIHPFSDADLLAGELPNATLLQANSILELRVAPERLTTEIADFIDGCWKPRPARRAPRRRASAS